MSNTIHLKRSFKSGAIQLEAVPLGRDWQIILSGGKAHIGAAALAVCYDADRAAVNVLQIAVYGHREDALCGELALTLSRAFKTTVAVSAGIHFDGLTAEEVTEVVRLSRELAEELIHLQSMG